MFPPVHRQDSQSLLYEVSNTRDNNVAKMVTYVLIEQLQNICPLAQTWRVLDVVSFLDAYCVM